MSFLILPFKTKKTLFVNTIVAGSQKKTFRNTDKEEDKKIQIQLQKGTSTEPYHQTPKVNESKSQHASNKAYYNLPILKI